MIEWKWRLFQYVSATGRRAIDDWRRKLPIGGPRADLDAFLKLMAKSEKWEYPDIDSLKGDRYKGLTELRWKSGGVQHRILGYATNAYNYLMLVGCTHKGQVYKPPDAMETARRRRDEIERMEATIVEYQLIADK